MEHSWTRPPSGRREREPGGGSSGGRGGRRDARPRSRPGPAPAPAPPASPPGELWRERGGTLRAPSCPARGLRCRPRPRRWGGGEAGPLRARPEREGPPRCHPLPLSWLGLQKAGEGGRGVADPPPQFRGSGDVATAQASSVSFFQFLSLTFPVSLFLDLN